MNDFTARLARSLCQTVTPCKICGAASAPYGTVDFNRACDDKNGKILPDCGVPIAYLRCTRCKFIYTNAFDNWSHDDFRTFIYNDDYLKVDPEYTGFRAEYDAGQLDRIFPDKKDVHVLDYGGGNGMLAKLLVKKGFASAETYDPFVPAHATKPDKNYDLVTCVETLEHLPDPADGIAKIVAHVGPAGVVMFTTLIQSPLSDPEGIDWWYIAPRNGHISIFSLQSLAFLWKRHGFGYGLYNSNLHLAWRAVPGFARHILGDGKHNPAF